MKENERELRKSTETTASMFGRKGETALVMSREKGRKRLERPVRGVVGIWVCSG
jgi:hypothetical protein